MADSHSFILAVFLMYGFIFMIYVASDGAIAGLPSASGFEPTAPEVLDWSIIDYIVQGIGLVVSFLTVLFLPLTDLWYFVPINWAIIGTSIYLFLKLIRGGG